MASFWGEVVPVGSRALDDEDEDEDDDLCPSPPILSPPDCNMILNPSLPPARLPCRLLVVADQSAAAHFLDVALLWKNQSVLLGILNTGFVKGDGFPPKGVLASSSCAVRQLRPGSDVVLVRNTATVFPEQLHSWQNQLLGLLQFQADTRVVVLTSQNVTNYLTSLSMPTASPPFLRVLFTSAARPTMTNSPCPPLEAPNILQGPVAQLMTTCEIRGIQAAAFVCYSNAHFESAAITSFAPLLQTSFSHNLGGLEEANLDMQKHVKEIVLRHERGSLLYT